MKILIIGGTRFIGRHLTKRLLEQGHEVVLFNRGKSAATDKTVETIVGDRRNLADYREKLLQGRFEGVVDMIPMNDTDTAGVIDIFRGSITASVHITSQDVYAAWEAVHRNTKTYPVPIDESSPRRHTKYLYRGKYPGTDDYDKTLVEECLERAARDYGFPATVLRFPKTYGEFDPQYRFYHVVRRVRDGRPTLLVNDERNWLWTDAYVGDAIRAIELALTRTEAVGETFNIGNPKTMTIAQTAEKIAQMMGSSIDVVSVPPEFMPDGDKPDYFPAQHILTDTAKIRSLLGYQESYTLDEGYSRTIEWTLANPPAEFHDAFDYEKEDRIIERYRRAIAAHEK